MKKFLFYGMFMLFAVSLTADAQKTLNGVEIYQAAEFPCGKQLKADVLVSLPEGKWQQPIYLTEPIEFKDNGVSDGKGCYIYTGKVDHTLVGRLFVKITNPSAASALFKIKFPYKTPLYPGFVYNFTSPSPLTVVSKTSSMDSDGKKFSVYNCVYQGYLIINNTSYPGK